MVHVWYFVNDDQRERICERVGLTRGIGGVVKRAIVKGSYHTALGPGARRLPYHQIDVRARHSYRLEYV